MDEQQLQKSCTPKKAGHWPWPIPYKVTVCPLQTSSHRQTCSLWCKGLGSDLLLWCKQDESEATHAPKLSKEEGVLDFRQPALQLHNKVNFHCGCCVNSRCPLGMKSCDHVHCCFISYFYTSV